MVPNFFDKSCRSFFAGQLTLWLNTQLQKGLISVGTKLNQKVLKIDHNFIFPRAGEQTQDLLICFQTLAEPEHLPIFESFKNEHFFANYHFQIQFSRWPVL